MPDEVLQQEMESVSPDRFESVLGVLEQFPHWAISAVFRPCPKDGESALLGMGVCPRPPDANPVYRGYYFPFGHGDESADLSVARKVEFMATMSGRDAFTGYDIKRMLHRIGREGLRVGLDTRIEDLRAWVRCVVPTREADLGVGAIMDKLLGENCGLHEHDYAERLKREKGDAGVRVTGIYGATQAVRNMQLRTRMLRQYRKDAPLFKMQSGVTRALYQMEVRGLAVDGEYVEQCRVTLEARLEKLKEEIRAAGFDGNPRSPKQIEEFFEAQKVESSEKTASGKSSWTREALLNADHPLGKAIVGYRHAVSMLDNYVEPYRNIKAVHADFDNSKVVTGRIAARYPSIQTVPKGDSDGLLLRRMFVPRPNYVLFRFDYRQMELCVLIAYLNNQHLRAALLRGEDLHDACTEMVFGVSPDSPEFDAYRKKSKHITFGIIYGKGLAALARDLEITEDEARTLRNNYYARFPGMKEFIGKVRSDIISSASDAEDGTGEIRSMYGRRYAINPDVKNYIGTNYLVQGTAADIAAGALAGVSEFLSDKKSGVVAHIHDEVLVEMHETELKYVPDVVRLLKKNSQGVALEVDTEVCHPSWGTPISLETFKKCLTGKENASMLKRVKDVINEMAGQQEVAKESEMASEERSAVAADANTEGRQVGPINVTLYMKSPGGEKYSTVGLDVEVQQVAIGSGEIAEIGKAISAIRESAVPEMKAAVLDMQSHQGVRETRVTVGDGDSDRESPADMEDFGGGRTGKPAF